MLEDLKAMKIENNNNLTIIYNSISQSLNKCVYCTGDWWSVQINNWWRQERKWSEKSVTKISFTQIVVVLVVVVDFTTRNAFFNFIKTFNILPHLTANCERGIPVMN